VGEAVVGSKQNKTMIIRLLVGVGGRGENERKRGKEKRGVRVLATGKNTWWKKERKKGDPFISGWKGENLRPAVNRCVELSLCSQFQLWCVLEN
jgi:hypothetical protein